MAGFVAIAENCELKQSLSGAGKTASPGVDPTAVIAVPAPAHLSGSG
jgi:hypothetical protein